MGQLSWPQWRGHTTVVDVVEPVECCLVGSPLSLELVKDSNELHGRVRLAWPWCWHASRFDGGGAVGDAFIADA